MTEAPLMLSVSGLRGIIGRSLTPVVAARYGEALGQWFRTGVAAGQDNPHIVVGRDSRPSGAMIEMAFCAGLAGVGCKITRLGIVTTPSVATMIDHLDADGGAVVTASHNPIEWNGIKALGSDGSAPPAAEAGRIAELFRAESAPHVSVHDLAPVQANDDANDVHVRRALENVNVDAIRGRKLKIVIDSVCGAGGEAAKRLMGHLDAELIHLYPEPTGVFPHGPEPTRDNLIELSEAVKAHGADVGFAQDPDADRLAIVDETGRYIGEEYTLALACQHLLTRADAPSRPVIVANLSTSRMIDDIAQQIDATVIRTPVGEANVAAAMRQHHAAIGGEGNGGVIWPAVVCVRDSIGAMALTMEMLANPGLKLSSFVQAVPSYAIVKDKVTLDGQLSEASLSTVAERFVESYDDVRIDRQDGVRIDWPDRWVHLRASNTEPILRIIAEASEQVTSHKLIDEVRHAIREAQPA